MELRATITPESLNEILTTDKVFERNGHLFKRWRNKEWLDSKYSWLHEGFPIIIHYYHEGKLKIMRKFDGHVCYEVLIPSRVFYSLEQAKKEILNAMNYVPPR